MSSRSISFGVEKGRLWHAAVEKVTYDGERSGQQATEEEECKNDGCCGEEYNVRILRWGR
jgi:hypothetical protein